MQMEKNLKRLRQKKRSNRVLVLGHNPLDYKSILKHPFDYKTKRGLHPPAPTSLLYDNWQDFNGDIITCHFQNYNSLFVVAAEPSPRFHESGGIKVSNVPAYNKENKDAYDGMISVNMDPDDYYYIDIPKIFRYNGNSVLLYTGFLAVLFACMLEYEEIYTAGIDGTIIGYEGGFVQKKKHIKAMKQFVRKGSHKKIGVYKNKKPTTMIEWEDWKTTENYSKRLDYILDYCNNEYPESKIYKSHHLSKLNTEIRDPFQYA